eukprot:6095115-Pleurochrysis_carterae.AAC.3
MQVEEVQSGYVVDVARLSLPDPRQESISYWGHPFPSCVGRCLHCSRRCRHCHPICTCVCFSVESRSSRVTGSASAKLARISSGHRMNLRHCNVAFIIVNEGFSQIPFASRSAEALGFVAPCTFQRSF